MNDLKESVVIITGAGSGIGAALAQGFSRAGARVTLAARRKEKLEATAAECARRTPLPEGRRNRSSGPSGHSGKDPGTLGTNRYPGQQCRDRGLRSVPGYHGRGVAASV
ncbi:MAG: SDR family NAD(P)-dependent oxidoreductase [Desulfobacteraceae bacterium]|nr:MAG: SDR family NAD(P)-dependent oxidoreductase [Desulfobacteraceae bacterium]